MVTCDSHHPALYLEHNLCDTFVPYENNDITILAFENCDFESINSFLIKKTSTGSILSYNEFCKLKSECKNMSRICKYLYMKNIESGIQDKVFNFWKYIRTKQLPP